MSTLDRPLLTVRDVAALTGLSEYTVREAVRDGDLEGIKIRGRIRVREDALTVWLDQNTIRPTGALTQDHPTPPRPRTPAPTGGYRQRARELRRVA